jgi:hypothetical protein
MTLKSSRARTNALHAPSLIQRAIRRWTDTKGQRAVMNSTPTMPLLQRRLTRKADALSNPPIPAVSIIGGAHHAVPEHLSKAQTAKVYDAGVQNRTAPQTICSCDPLRSLLFRRCRRRRLFAVWQASTPRSRQAARSNVRGGVDQNKATVFGLP